MDLSPMLLYHVVWLPDEAGRRGHGQRQTPNQKPSTYG